MPKLAIPTVHLNGTSRDGLMEPILAVLSTIDRLQFEMQAVHPNGRDYYVQDPGAIQIAVDQHRARCKALNQIRQELDEIALGISEGRTTSEVEAAS